MNASASAGVVMRSMDSGRTLLSICSTFISVRMAVPCIDRIYHLSERPLIERRKKGENTLRTSVNT